MNHFASPEFWQAYEKLPKTIRDLADRMLMLPHGAVQLVNRLVEQNYGATLTRRDLNAAPPALLTEGWVGANFTDEAERSDEQKALLAGSDELIAELEAADTIVITAPIYNFAIPASLKAWVDLIARARRSTPPRRHGSPILPTGLPNGCLWEPSTTC